ncbi:MAG: D-alanyl-D-alanine carboxypeptidase [Lachnospiraceae bacterium]|nr:D-alanyl-D-alanine carboxypeptidase [Lachnospiraceae bacterium]
MSFFNWKDNKGKNKKREGTQYDWDTLLIWGFAACLAICCLLFKQYDNINDSRQQIAIHHFDYSEERVETVDGEIEEDNAPANLYAKYALLMDASNRRVLFEKSGYEKVPMASTTKIMTLLVTLENANLQDKVTVSEYAASMPDVQLNIREGEQYVLSDLLYSLMLESHNDTAVAIAEHVGGSVEGFAEMMNQKAKELGAYNTNFVTPNGLDAPEHYTTAYDLALIASYAIQNEAFLQYTQAASHSFQEISTGRSFTVNNKNKFLSSYDGAIGIKTGFTNDAGYCFVGAVRQQEKTFVSVVLACGWPPNKNYKWKDTTKLMDYGVNEFEMKEIITKGTAFQQIPVDNAIEGNTITPQVTESVSLLVGKEDISYDVKLPKLLSAPVEEGETVGEVVIYIGDEIYKVLPLHSVEERNEITYQYILENILRDYFFIFQG